MGFFTRLCTHPRSDVLFDDPNDREPGCKGTIVCTVCGLDIKDWLKPSRNIVRLIEQKKMEVLS